MLPALGNGQVVSSFPFLPLVADVFNRIPECNGARRGDLPHCAVVAAIFGVPGYARHPVTALQWFPVVIGFFFGFLAFPGDLRTWEWASGNLLPLPVVMCYVVPVGFPVVIMCTYKSENAWK